MDYKKKIMFHYSPQEIKSKGIFLASTSEIQFHHWFIRRLNISSQAITIELDRGDSKLAAKSGLHNHFFFLFRDNKTQSEVLVNYSSNLDAMIVQLADSGILKKKSC